MDKPKEEGQSNIGYLNEKLLRAVLRGFQPEFIDEIVHVANVYEASQAEIATLKKMNGELVGALGLVDIYFQRMLASDNFMGDEEHETWKTVTTALAKWNKEK